MRMDVVPAGKYILLRPTQGAPDAIAEFVADYCGTVPSRALGGYVLRPADLPALARAAIVSDVHLSPSTSLAPFLRAEAEALRTENSFFGEQCRGLYPFQCEGVSFLRGRRSALLFDEMGLGKTPQALCAASNRVCIVCPSVLKSNWAAECKRWRPDLLPVVFNGRGTFQWPADGECVIINYDVLPEDFGLPDGAVSLIFDEAQALKNWKSKRTRAGRKMVRRVYKTDGTAWLLTGTPLMNKPSELWAMLQALGLGSELYGNYQIFVKLFGGETDALGQTTWDPSAVSCKAMSPIRPLALRRTRADVLPELPAKMYQTVLLGIPQIRLATMDDAPRRFDSIESLMERMADDPGMMGDRKRLAEWKIPALLAHVEAYEDVGEPLVVFSAHRAPIEALAGRQGWAAIMGGSTGRDEAVRAFQAGELRGLACTIRAAGVGLTLTRGAHMIFVDRDWTPAANLQAEDRLVRIGQTRGVSIVDLVADHQVDKAVTDLLIMKTRYQQETVAKLDAPFIPRDRLAEAAELERLADDIDAG